MSYQLPVNIKQQNFTNEVFDVKRPHYTFSVLDPSSGQRGGGTVVTMTTHINAN